MITLSSTLRDLYIRKIHVRLCLYDSVYKLGKFWNQDDVDFHESLSYHLRKHCG